MSCAIDGSGEVHIAFERSLLSPFVQGISEATACRGTVAAIVARLLDATPAAKRVLCQMLSSGHAVFLVRVETSEGTHEDLVLSPNADWQTDLVNRVLKNAAEAKVVEMTVGLDHHYCCSPTQ